jgi:RimJ/RimL family protein N-acetyltransferase
MAQRGRGQSGALLKAGLTHLVIPKIAPLSPPHTQGGSATLGNEVQLMHACPTDHPALPRLFERTLPNNPVLWAVLQGRHAGRAWVDDVRRPTQCVLRTDAVLTFASPQTGQSFLDAALARARRTGDVWLVWSAELYPQLRAPQAAEVEPRREFYDCDPHSPELTALRRRLPVGFEMRPIDRDLLERCEWGPDMAFYCGSLDNFLARDLGLCMLRGDDIIVEAYASSLGKTQAEIGAVTRAAYRGRGYAPIACAYLIQLLEQRGYRPYWSCDVDNPASIRVARKLGFRQEKAYQILEYSAHSPGE